MTSPLEQCRDALRSVTVACDALHHAKRDRHGIGQACPVETRIAEALAAADAALAAQPEPVTLADVLDALNLFNRPKPSEDDGPWEGGHFIRVDYLPDFINIIAAAWFSPVAAPVAAPVAQPLTDAEIEEIVLQSVYEGDKSVIYREQWTRDIGAPFARAIERAHGIESKDQQMRAQKYASQNPLGGPAKVFDACADAIRAGDPIDQAMANFGLAWAPKEPA